MERIIRETIEIELRADEMNREEGFFSLNKSWKPLFANPEGKKECLPLK
jgi:hypothetical protein